MKSSAGSPESQCSSAPARSWSCFECSWLVQAHLCILALQAVHGLATELPAHLHRPFQSELRVKASFSISKDIASCHCRVGAAPPGGGGAAAAPRGSAQASNVAKGAVAQRKEPWHWGCHFRRLISGSCRRHLPHKAVRHSDSAKGLLAGAGPRSTVRALFPSRPRPRLVWRILPRNARAERVRPCQSKQLSTNLRLPRLSRIVCLREFQVSNFNPEKVRNQAGS